MNPLFLYLECSLMKMQILEYSIQAAHYICAINQVSLLLKGIHILFIV